MAVVVVVLLLLLSFLTVCFGLLKDIVVSEQLEEIKRRSKKGKRIFRSANALLQAMVSLSMMIVALVE
jgi:hypothetical protein